MNHTPCANREPWLEALLFDELDPGERTALEDHVEHCTGCADALEDARAAMSALAEVFDPPLPYREEDGVTRAWNDFQRRLPTPSVAPKTGRAYELVAMAAVLVIGIGLGRLMAPTPVSGPSGMALESAAISSDAIDALERADLLADAGVRYVEGLQDLLADVTELSVDTVSTEDLLLTRERAGELLRDGQLLELALDRYEDRAFLHAIRRAELFLEELAAIERSGSGTSVSIFQASLRDSPLGDELAALNLERDVSRAIEASGWIGRDDASRKEF